MEDGPPGQSQYRDLYDAAVTSLLDVSVTDRWFDTCAGRTHALTTGESTAPPIIVFQGGNVTNPVTLSWFQELSDEFHIIAPDTPGEPGKSSSERPREFGLWVADVLDAFEIDRAPMIGASHGAGVLLEAAEYAPERIDTGALVVPAGFGTPFSFDLVRIVSAALAYRFVPRRGLLTRALAPMVSEPVGSIDEVIVETIGTALRTGELGADFPGPSTRDALAGFRPPTVVITGENDPFFTGPRTCERARQSLPSLVECLTLPNERHFLSAPGQERATALIRSHLHEHTD
jgi:pimeloyl-ACP methyl ester carboxylesterase